MNYDFIRYKIRTIKNASFKVVFFSASADTESQFDISINNSTGGIPTICVVGGNLNLETIVPAVQALIVEINVESGLSIDEKLTLLLSEIASTIISISTSMFITHIKSTSLHLSQRLIASNTMLIDAEANVEREVNTDIPVNISVDSMLNAMTSQLLTFIVNNIIDIDSDSIIDLPNPLKSTCVFANSVISQSEIKQPNASLVDKNYTAIINSNVFLKNPSSSTADESGAVEVVCVLGMLRYTQLKDYDTSILLNMDNQNLFDLKYQLIL